MFSCDYFNRSYERYLLADSLADIGNECIVSGKDYDVNQPIDGGAYPCDILCDIKAESFQERLDSLEALAQAVARFPSLLERHELIGGTRTPTSLIDSLIDHQDAGDSTLQLPSKAMLGKGLLVAKMHTFSSFAKYTHHIPELKSYSKAFDTETVTSMYSLLIEDV